MITPREALLEAAISDLQKALKTKDETERVRLVDEAVKTVGTFQMFELNGPEVLQGVPMDVEENPEPSPSDTPTISYED